MAQRETKLRRRLTADRPFSKAVTITGERKNVRQWRTQETNDDVEIRQQRGPSSAVSAFCRKVVSAVAYD